MFRLFQKDDRQEMADTMGEDVMQEIRKRAFWHFDGDEGTLHYYRQIRVNGAEQS
jgi:hypothetical protein